jgi:hypothetical protein
MYIPVYNLVDVEWISDIKLLAYLSHYYSFGSEQLICQGWQHSTPNPPSTVPLAI